MAKATHLTKRKGMQMKTRISGLIATLALMLPMMAEAGSPDNPGEKGEIVNRDKAYWQDHKGKNGWGNTVSDVATLQEGGNKETSLGAFLSFMGGGPNPFNDRGKGND